MKGGCHLWPVVVSELQPRYRRQAPEAFYGEGWADLRKSPAPCPISLPVGPGVPGPTGLWGNE